MGETVQDILQFPVNVEGVGKIYPITISNYDEFMAFANILSISEKHFDLELYKETYGDINLKLLDLIFLDSSNEQNKDLTVYIFEKIFSFVCKQKIEYDHELEAFVVGDRDNGLFINRYNYNEVRKVIMEQNLITEPRVFKDKLLRSVAEKYLKHRAKNSLNTSIEDMISLIVVNGHSFKEIEEWSIYQVKSVFQRILRLETWRAMMALKTIDYEGKINPDHFAEAIELTEDPYKDFLKDKKKLTLFKQSDIKGG